MKAARSDQPLHCPTQAQIDFFLKMGIEPTALACPTAMKVARGHAAHDGRFESDAGGRIWFAFEEPGADDLVFWQARTGEFATWSGRAFAFGEEIIDQAATYAFDCALNIFADPMDWLRAGRDGIVVLDWSIAFDRLRDAPRIAIAEEVLPLYRRHMKPAHMPELLVIAGKRRAA